MVLTTGNIVPAYICRNFHQSVSIFNQLIHLIMKKSVFSILFLFVFASFVSAQINPQGKENEKPVFKWLTSTDHDFGKLKQGVPATTTFEFTNEGTADLVLSNVKPSCGCTTPEYSKDPIPPKGKGFIKATYNAASMGSFQKSITVSSNVSEQPVILTIKGEVEKAEEKNPVVTPEPVKVVEPTRANPLPAVPAATKTEVATVSKTINVYFGNGSSAVSTKDLAELDKIAAEVKTGSQYILLSGYASKVGKPSVNQKLSEARANNVKNYLVKKGINADRIGVQSYGDAASSGTDNDRRVEVQVINR